MKASQKTALQETGWLEYANLIRKIFQDAKRSEKLVSRRQVRYLVDTYYQLQRYRISTANQVRSCVAEPCQALEGVFVAMEACEAGIRHYLGKFAQDYAAGQWAMSICGIGPVITAGLLAHLDIREALTAGHFYSFAGLNPTAVWETGQKRPWNAKLKVLCCFKLGESFVKVQANSKDFYGKIYRDRKQYEIARNVAGANAEAATAQLAAKKISQNTECYKHLSNGQLPPAQIHARARRYAVKIFLSHLHHVMFHDFYGTDPPVPFAFTQACAGQHTHYIPPPNFPHAFDGKCLRELLDAVDLPPDSLPEQLQEDEGYACDVEE